MESTAPSESSPYVYKALETATTIRIFEIFCDERDQRIRGRISHKNLKAIPLRPPGWEAPDGSFLLAGHSTPPAGENIFEAVSYRWGSPDDPETVFCDGGTLKISKNLHAALLSLRPAAGHPPRPLWADQICINQSDLTERAIHVRFMGQIFYQARNVIAFLGEEDPHTRPALELAEHLGAYHWCNAPTRHMDWFAETPAMRTLPDPQGTVAQLREQPLPQYKGVQDDQDDAPEDPRWISWRAFWTKEWFGRTWILQEYLLVSGDMTIMCGSIEVDIASLIQARHAAADLQIASAFTCSRTDKAQQKAVTRGLTCLDSMNRLCEGYLHGLRLPIVSLLESARNTEATDARDKFFALANLAEDADQPELYPDYTLSLQEVSLRYARHIITSDPTGKNLSKLLAAGGQGQPTYVLLNSSQLQLRGRFLGTVQDTGLNHRAELSQTASPAYSTYGPLAEAVKVITSHTWRKYPTGESLWQAFWRTLSADKDFTSNFMSSNPASRQLQASVIACLKCALYTNDDRDVPNLAAFTEHLQGMTMEHCRFDYTFDPTRDFLFKMQQIDDVRELMHLAFTPEMVHQRPSSEHQELATKYRQLCLLTCIEGRTMAITNNMYMAIVPDTVRKGDRICVFDGIYTPWVVRSAGEGEEKGEEKGKESYVLIGACYVHGFMEGQAYAGRTAKEVVEIVLV